MRQFEVHSQGMFTLHFLSLYNIVLANCHGCTNFFLLFMQMNLSGKVQFVFANVLGNLLIPLISKKPNDIPMWNKKVNEYLLESLILLRFSYPLMGLSCYFTQMTLEFWRSSLI